MIKRVLMGCAAVALVTASVSWAGPSSGLAKGDKVPTIHFDAINDDRGEYCVTCTAGQKPVVVAFVTKADDATKELLTKLDEAYRANRDAKLYGGVVILGDGADAEALKEWATAAKLAVPTGHVPAVTDEIKLWKLNGEVSSTVLFIKQRTVQASVANLPAAEVAQHVGEIVG